MISPLVSIIIPVYNTEERYLRACMAPFVEHEDDRVEVILVDDGSRSETNDVLRNIASQCKIHTRLIRRENGGQNAARNTGIEAARGEYIEFLDSDDRIDWHAQLKVLESLTCHKPDILGINVICVTETGEAINSWSYSASSNEDYLLADKRTLLLRCSALWQQIIRRDLFTRTGIALLQGIYIGEDLASIMPLIMAANSVAVLNVPLYRFVSRPTSITHEVHAERLLDITKAFNYVLRWMEKANISTVFSQETEYEAIRHVLFAGIGRAIEWEGVHSQAIDQLWVYMQRTFPHWRENRLYQQDLEMHGLKYRLLLAKHYRMYEILRHAKHVLVFLKVTRNLSRICCALRRRTSAI